jgi:hypothetical protein
MEEWVGLAIWQAFQYKISQKDHFFPSLLGEPPGSTWLASVGALQLIKWRSNANFRIAI